MLGSMNHALCRRAEYNENSVFRGTEIPRRVEVRAAAMTLATLATL